VENAARREILFQEVQRFRQSWIWAMMAVSVAVVVALLLAKVLSLPGPQGADARVTSMIILGVLCIAVAISAMIMRIAALNTEVRADGLYVKFFPFHWSFQRIPLENLKGIAVTTYRPILDYGGWGIRYGIAGKAYNVSGNRGVKLTFFKGRSLLIGSQQPEELAEALEAFRSQTSSR
jgi:hypothetical protein